MLITQVVNSATIESTGRVEYVRVDPSVNAGILGTGLYKKEVFDLNDDPRILKLISTLETQMSQSHWRSPEHEREICESLVRTMHRKDFFGSCNRKVIEHPDLNLKFDEVLKLRDLKSGQLVCKQMAAITSYVLDKVGIRNDFCAGPSVYSETGVGCHAFVQTASGNIVETTDAVYPFCRGLNHQRIRDGGIAIVWVDAGYSRTYGGGRMNAFESICYTLSAHKTSLVERKASDNILAGVQQFVSNADNLHRGKAQRPSR